MATNHSHQANMENNTKKVVVVVVRKGAWTKEEDLLLTRTIQHFGEGKWHLVPHRAGLNRCRKSCRMRWLNYLRPNVKRGYFDPPEVDLIQRLHKLLGNRWSLIAGRIPGRTANDVKNFWNTHICKKQPNKTTSYNQLIIKPRPRNLTLVSNNDNKNNIGSPSPSLSSSPLLPQEDCSQWFRELLQMSETENGQGTELGPPEYDMSDLLVDFMPGITLFDY